MSKTTIAIAGLGWLGLPLAQKLSTLGYSVKGSVTQLEKAASLQQQGFNVFPVMLTQTGVQGSIAAFLKDVSILIIMIPPGLRGNTGSDYVLKMAHFLEAIEQQKVEKVIFVSSTSVYGDAQGMVTEKELPQPETEAGKQLLQVEQLFFNAPFLQSSIVRFGGLYGGARQPARYLAGRTNLSNGDAPVNLIHREDCLGILTEIIKQNAFGHLFNAVSPEHPTKRNYYTAIAKGLGLEPPSYQTLNEELQFKQVDSVNLEVVLNYSFSKTLG